jgi:hypothetical protein
VVFCLPFFNLLVFFIRFAGIINSINTNSAWKTKNFTEEKAEFRRVVQQEFSVFFGILNKIRGAVNTEPVE